MAITKKKVGIWGTVLGTAGLATAVLLTPTSAVQFHTSKYHKIGGGTEIYKPQGDTSWHSGDTLAILQPSNGKYITITFGNLQGKRGDSIVIINDAGVVATSGYIKFTNNCSFFKITGSGDQNVRYGFNACITLDKASHWRVSRCEPTDGNIGIFAVLKSNPVDSNSWYPRTDVGGIVDDNYLHRIHGEGMYLGRTTMYTDDEDPLHNPAWRDSLFVTDNILDSCDWDGIQTANTRFTKILRNRVTNYGLKAIQDQQGGIVMGGNTDNECAYNFIKKGTGNGIQGFGYGVSIHDNQLDSCGTALGQQSIITKDVVSHVDLNPIKQTVRIFNNTIRHPNTGLNWNGGITNVIKAFYENNFADSCVINNNSIYDVPTNYQAIISLVPKSRVIGNVLNGQATPPPTDIPPVNPPTPTDSVALGKTSIGTINYRIPVTNNHKIKTITVIEKSLTGNGGWSAAIQRTGKATDTIPYATAVFPLYIRLHIKKENGVWIDSTKAIKVSP